MSPNQIVAFNLERLRRGRSWTALETAKKLGKLLGRKISLPSYSAMERSVEGRRVKSFDADEIYAIARMFGTHVGLLFAPPINFHSPSNGKFGSKLYPVRVCPKGAPASQSLSRGNFLNFIMSTVEDVPEGVALLAGRKLDRRDEPPLSSDNPLDREVLRLASDFLFRRLPATSALEQENQQKELLAEALPLFSKIYAARQQKPPDNSGTKGKRRKRPHVSGS
jgi:hypothetical protein